MCKEEIAMGIRSIKKIHNQLDKEYHQIKDKNVQKRLIFDDEMKQRKIFIDDHTKSVSDKLNRFMPSRNK